MYLAFLMQKNAIDCKKRGFRTACGGGAELNILDMACGCGANVMYMANIFRNSQFVGMDINEEFINYGNNQLADIIHVS